MLLPLAVLTVAGLAIAAWRATRPAVGAAPAGHGESAVEGEGADLNPPAEGDGSTGPLAELLGQVGGTAGIVGAGLALAELGANLVDAAGGSELEKNLARVGGPAVAVPILLKEGVGAVLGELGVEDEGVKEGVGQAVAVSVFAAPLLPLFGAVKLGEGLVNLFAGDERTPFPWAFKEIFGEAELLKLSRAQAPLQLFKAVGERRRLFLGNHLMPGTHVVRVRVSGDELWEEPPFFRLLVNGQAVTRDTPAAGPKHRGLWQEHFFRVTLNNSDTIAIGFPNAQLNPDGMRTLWVNWLEIEGTRYLPEEGYYYRWDVTERPMPTIPGQPGMHWNGALAWKLKPEHRGSGFPIKIPFKSAPAAEFEAAEQSLKLVS